LKAPDTVSLTYGSVAGIFVLVMNSAPIFAITNGYEILHLLIIVLALYMLSLSPFELLHTKLIQALDCSRLLKAEAIGVLVGSALILPMVLLSGLSGFLSHAVQLVVSGGLGLFFAFYNFTFSNMFSQIAETGTSGRPRWGPDLVSRRGFSGMLLATNIYPILPIAALLVASQFVLVLIIVVFQAVSSLAAFELHGLSIKWTQATSTSQTQPATGQSA